MHFIHLSGVQSRWTRGALVGWPAALSQHAGLRERGKGEVQARQKPVALDDAIFGQVAELHVAEGLPWADHCDVSAKTLHARDVVTKALLARLGGLALEGTSCPLLELGWSLLWCGGTSGTGSGQCASCRVCGVHFCC